MDRIQKALDKAKQKHAGIEVEPDNTVIQTETQEKTSFPEDPLAPPLQNIEYTQTKVVKTPQSVLENNRVIAGHYNNPQSAVFRMLRTQVLQKMRQNDWQTIAITSPTAGEGKSLVSANLAVAIAMELNQTVLLVDMDLRNPSIASYFGLNVEAGLKEYLEDDLYLHHVLVNPGIERLVILPGMGRAEDSAELLSSPKMASLVKDIKSQYNSRLIIFDVPPLLQTDDVLMSSNYFDCTLLVLEDGKNNEENIKKSLQLLEGTHLVGTVLNKAETHPTHQNY
ncbi:CpsD/CapB family tyrosine-protein kinase [Methylophaga thalassica]|uniref:Non-specific protein-tyrosine kinase n=1 Tax=Methylophaga aminisulfidivorans MP TaxID=1026882 RepID=F5T2X6_9GAMM|nr:CpsD/CapB family tyrosine-protein kinase [Methylophaga aminisulfidivorans]EGL53337.1 non-specific protein-tyrosine kinase [Methylophaga aminisulfidivorans MP]